MNGFSQICLVSKQAMPNIIPALMYKPNRVILLATIQEKGTAENIKKVLRKNKVHCEIHKEIVDAYDVNSVSNACQLYINKKNEDFILNMTGGTKIMAIAAYEAFRRVNKRSLYCDTEENKIIHFHSGNITKSDIRLKIKVEDYLQSYGFRLSPYHTIDKKERAVRNKSFIDFVFNNTKSYLEFVDYIKPLVSNSPLTKYLGYGDYELKPLPGGYELSHLKKTIFKANEIGEIIGTWFEDYTYYKIIKNELDDILLGQNIISGGKLRNEIDIMFTKNCKLYLISCKNKKLEKNINKQDLFELDGLRSLAGGTFAKAFKVLTNEPEENLKNRAIELKIDIKTIYQLNDFKI